MSKRISLNGGDWLFKDFYGEDWRLRNSHMPDSRDWRGWRRGSVPGCPQHDLWRLGEIPDPYVERNSLLSEWIPQRTWLYKKTFTVDKELEGRRIQLRFEDVFVRPQLSTGLRHADVSVLIDLNAALTITADVDTILRHAGTVVAHERTRYDLEVGPTCLETCLEVQAPELWWPNGCGEQRLYEAEVRIIPCADQTGSRGWDDISDTHSVPFGIRRIELLQNESADPDALPYTFLVNGRRIYAKGWNWVPMDVMYSVPRPAKLERLLILAKRAHVNLLRVWGGGLIEKEDFYEQCDRLGIMVWQEFIQSSSGIENIPSTSPEYVRMVRETAEQIIPRKRNHPSLVVWCGGNELSGEAERPLDDSHTVLEALRNTIKRLDPDRLWLPTSPSGTVFGNSLEKILKDPSGLHDVHGPWEYQGVTI